MTDLWTNLAPVYDRLFPPGRIQMDFLLAVLGRPARPARRVLDAGCGTGGYTLALVEAGFGATGVDYDPEMIRVARAKAEKWERDRKARLPGAKASGRGPRPRFEVADLTDLRAFPEDARPFDAVICLGNTLANLLSAADLGRAFGEMARLTARGGQAVFQTINYDRLAATGQAHFPAISFAAAGEPFGAEAAPEDGATGTDRPDSAARPLERRYVFHRLYLPRGDGLVTFVTSIREEAGGHLVFRSESLLRPVSREELETVARMAFHGPVEVYGDFLFSRWSVSSPATVVVVGKDD